ncbi:alpha-L-arabinofuranosidase C-terminal domain-containing protein [Dictyobacter kobayashii]|uniref:alpha-L-arabinofuranosidase C-terminal domain-containing protein n=1 Tax=Dictyobacter kobayashii TaxID=2014872 RepID=UPI001386F69D|nr:alpha-L-arabinofuranosidase C-terminal domain-containing protein [Dictyobacter kobayashii]
MKKAREFAKVMKWTDPSIQLVGCGETGWTEWDQTVIAGLAPLIDYYSLHLYTGSDDYYSNVLAPALVDFALESCRATIDRVRFSQQISHPIHIAFDEWNVWYRQRSAESALEERYNLADALAVSSYLNSFVRHSDIVKMANLAQLVNVIAPIFTSKEGLFLQTIYHPLRLYAEQLQEVTLDAYVDCKQLTLTADQEKSRWSPSIAALGPFNALDVTVTRDSTGHEFALAVVNRDLEQNHTTTIQFADPTIITRGLVYEVNAPDPASANSFEQPDAVIVQEHQLELEDGNITYTFPAHSLTILRLHIE